MKQTIMLQEIGNMRFAEWYGRQRAGGFTQEAMAEALIAEQQKAA